MSPCASWLRKSQIAVLVAILYAPPVNSLTGGPSEPAALGPSAHSADGLVDPFTGDFQYSIPILDLPGPQGNYTFVINYRSGIQTEQEAAWVGLGWSFEPGRISRNVRGLPDDLAGDTVYQLFNQKPAKTVGGSGAVSGELFGFDSKIGPVKVSAKAGLEVFFDTYSGFGVGLKLSPVNVKLPENSNSSLGVSADLNTKNGMTVSANLAPNLGLGVLNPSYGAVYNSRTGLQSAYWGHASVPLFSPSYVGAPQVSQQGTGGDFSFKAGLSIWGFFPNGEVNGYYSTTNYSLPKKRVAFGFMNLHKATSPKEQQLDFVREKDAPLKPKTPNLPFTILTNDGFEISVSNGPSGSFRAFRNDLPIVGGMDVKGSNASVTYNIEAGGGAGAHVGGSEQLAAAETQSIGWFENGFTQAARQTFGDDSTKERLYFALESEPISERDLFHPDEARYVKLTGTKSADNKISGRTGEGDPPISSQRRGRPTFIRAVTEAEAVQFQWAAKFNHQGIKRPDNAMSTKLEHLAGFDVVASDGTHYIFAQPAYVTQEINCNFSVDPSETPFLPGQTTIEVKQEVANAISNWLTNPNQSIPLGLPSSSDKFLSCQTTPAYAHSFHLTSILGPNYLDADGIPGPSDGDLGHWVRFAYKLTPDYAYRSPYLGAHYTRGYEHTYLQDDRASFSFGKKELFVLDSAFTASHVVRFTTSDRLDARGASSIGQNALGSASGTAQKRLEKASLYRRGLDTPIKTVQLGYNYELAKNAPNSTAEGSGKLTLKKLWYEYGKDKSGALNAYRFDYNSTSSTANPEYQTLGKPGDKNSDRWGFYQPCHPIASWGGGSLGRCSNGDEPYTRQTEPPENAAAWSLRSIRTPSGASIRIAYEPDDYAHVQNERAAVMLAAPEQEIKQEPGGAEDPTIKIDLVKCGLRKPPASLEEAKAALQSLTRKADQKTANQIAFNAEILLRYDLSGIGNMWERVDGYLEIKPETNPWKITSCTEASCIAEIKLAKVKGFHPLAYAGWHHLKANQPQYSIPDVTPPAIEEDAASDELKSMARNIISMVANIFGMFTNYDAKANGENWASKARNLKLRFFDPEGFKRGGGVRVSRLSICDAGKSSTDCDDPRNAIGKTYSYTIEEERTDEGGTIVKDTVSSGVAAYEPSLGGDEISLRRAKFYDEERILAPNDPAYFEHPVAEALFPAPVVGYRRVVEKTLAGAYATANPDSKTRVAGEREYEFYTAKEFPVRVRSSIIQKPEPVQELYPIPGVGSILNEEFAVSQGYSVSLNDMHGKPRRVAEYSLKEDGTRAEGVDKEQLYFYNISGQLLDPKVPVVYRSGDTINAAFGRRVEYYADMRISSSSTNSMGLSLNTDVLPFIIPVPVPTPWPSYNDSYKESRISVFHQIIYGNAVLMSTQNKDRSQTSTNRNLVFDEARGAPLLTSKTNAFEDEIFSFAVPAYWLHPGMGPALGSENDPLGGRNLLSANAVSIVSAENPLHSDSVQCCNPTVRTLEVKKVLDASLTLHWNQYHFPFPLLARHAPVLAGMNAMQAMQPWWSDTLSLDDLAGPKIWRPVATYRVDDLRLFAQKPWPRTDGRYQNPVVIPISTLPDRLNSGLPAAPIKAFDSLIASCAPRWKRTESFEVYHPRGPAMQSETPMGRHDALLYGQKAAVIQAVAQNATHTEIGYEGFESYAANKALTFPDLDDGNIDFWTGKDSLAYVWNEGSVGGTIQNGEIFLDCSETFPFPGGDIDPVPDLSVHIDSYLGTPIVLHPRVTRIERRDGYCVGIPDEKLPFSNREATIKYRYRASAIAVAPTHFKRDANIISRIWKWVVDLILARIKITDKVAHTGTKSLYLRDTVVFRQLRLAPKPGTYVLSAWVSRDNSSVPTFASSSAERFEKLGIGVVIGGGISSIEPAAESPTALFEPVGPIIDGWQRIEGEFAYDVEGQALSIFFQSGDGKGMYIDDIRVFPKTSSLQTFVYEPGELRLIARLDENNVATRWQYGSDGQLRYAERETERGWRTVQEHFNHLAESNEE